MKLTHKNRIREAIHSLRNDVTVNKRSVADHLQFILDDVKNEYQLSAVHPDDIRTVGYDPENMTEQELSHFAEKVFDGIMGYPENYWEAVEGTAQNLNLVKLPKLSEEEK